MPDSKQGLPGEMQYSNATTEMAKKIADMTGLSAMKVDHVLRGYFGALAGYTAYITESALASNDNNRPGKSLTDVLGGARFVKEPGNYTMNQFYETVNEATGLNRLMIKAAKTGDTDTLNRIRNEYGPEVRKSRAANYLQQQAGAVQQAISQTLNDPKMDDDTKKRRVTALRAMQRKLAGYLETM